MREFGCSYLFRALELDQDLHPPAVEGLGLGQAVGGPQQLARLLRSLATLGWSGP